MRQQDLLAEAFVHSRDLLNRYLVKFDDSNHTATAPGLPNHVAWCLGHLALTNHRFSEWLPGDSGSPESAGARAPALPATDFIEGAASGDSSRFGTESVCYGSNPLAPRVMFPTFDRCREIFVASVDRFAGCIRGLTDAQLVTPVPTFRNMMTPPYLLVARALYHVGVHNGQIADLRRALGMGSALG